MSHPNHWRSLTPRVGLVTLAVFVTIAVLHLAASGGSPDADTALASSTTSANADSNGPAGQSLGAILASDGSVLPGANGSFDARGFQVRLAPDGSPRFVAGAEDPGIANVPDVDSSALAVPADVFWDNRFGIRPGADEAIRAVAISGTEVYVGGDFATIAGVRAERIARWDGIAWSPLLSGTENGVRDTLFSGGSVNAIAIRGGEVIAGGLFDRAGGQPAQSIARWNRVRWSPLLSGTQDGLGGFGPSVSSLAVRGTELFVGGNFLTAGGVTASNVARWNGVAWSALVSGTGEGVRCNQFCVAHVFALAISGTEVYAGGNFTDAGGGPASKVARWDGVRWSPLLSGTDNGIAGSSFVNQVAALLVSGTDIYVGGVFTTAGGALATNVARWNGLQWSALLSGTANGVSLGLFPAVLSLASVGGEVIASGRFQRAGDLTVTNLARWNGQRWAEVAPDYGQERNHVVMATAAAGARLVVVDQFTGAGIDQSGTVGELVGQVIVPILPLSSTTQGVNGLVQSVVITGSDIYVGGAFNRAGPITANGIARWNGINWSPLLSGTANGVGGSNPSVRSIAISGTEVYAAGPFTLAGGAPAQFLARWDGVRWSPLLSGTRSDFAGPLGLNVSLIAAGRDGIFAAGLFTEVAGLAANYVARWDGVRWSALLSGTANGITSTIFVDVHALAVSGTQLYVGGTFDHAGGVTATNVARWNGVRWSPLLSGTAQGTNFNVRALAIRGPEIIVGGDFSQAGGVFVNGIARWDGIRWSALLSGTEAGVVGGNYPVWAVAASGNDVFVAGEFQTAGGDPATNIARWNGSRWFPVGSGVNGRYPVGLALAARPTELYAGGRFDQAGDKPSWNFARWTHQLSALTINDATVTEGNVGTSATFSVTLTGDLGITVTVAYSTANLSALAGSDYQPRSGTLAIPPFRTTGAITIPIIADTVQEPGESFFVNLSNPANATIARNQAIGTIVDDDPPAPSPTPRQTGPVYIPLATNRLAGGW